MLLRGDNSFDDRRLLVAPQDGGVLVMTLDTDELLDVARDATVARDHFPQDAFMLGGYVVR